MIGSIQRAPPGQAGKPDRPPGTPVTARSDYPGRHKGNCRAVAIALLLSLVLGGRAVAADFDGFPFVNDDGTLQLHHATIHLYGILIPPTDKTCTTFIRPIPCAPRAVLALKFNIGSEYVECDRVARNKDGTYIARCTANGQDISAMMLKQGWAAALPDAPYEYQVLEKMARARGIGIWGIPLFPSFD